MTLSSEVMTWAFVAQIMAFHVLVPLAVGAVWHTTRYRVLGIARGDASRWGLAGVFAGVVGGVGAALNGVPIWPVTCVHVLTLGNVALSGICAACAGMAMLPSRGALERTPFTEWLIGEEDEPTDP